MATPEDELYQLYMMGQITHEEYEAERAKLKGGEEPASPAPQPAASAPAAQPAAEEWYVAVNNAQQGPYNKAKVAAMLKSEEIKRDTPVWKKGMAGWTVISNVPELQDIIAELPPPVEAPPVAEAVPEMLTTPVRETVNEYTKAAEQGDEDAKKALERVKTYKPGDRGPAGGIIFYDKGNNADGWRYLEAAPVDFKKTGWGIVDVETKTGIGCGKRNTDLIAAALKSKGYSGNAAQLCAEYTLNGYNDWFLPSKEELNQLYINRASVGNMGTSLYWSSSQSDEDKAWFQGFSNAYQNVNSKMYSLNSVRAIRAF
uniref:Pentapeptide repeat protein n=1 Tax=uncultured bacterium contig00151 TaxID=1181590 RepID=A0A806KNZ9_9BACT|nr:pentapeptide repeat protein [uncultured bacterium contig00151]